MTSELRKVLVRLAKVLNKENITWALGASSLLNYHGLVDTVNDLDLLVIPSDIERFEEILLRFGEKEFSPPSDVYGTEYFGEFVIDGVNVDVMSRMKITNHDVTYVYPFDETSIVEKWMIDNEAIPMTSLEEWYILYNMIPNREKKVKIIEAYFKDHPVKYPHLLKRTENLPLWLIEKLEALL
ncbi:hypothetical protein EZV73_00800 [Acidaminobacter sp. JC074]|uniref:hypothetical protein n=1 Tax=Acidaminobacter sp. JC074 TaxID=2530199 RepID=UPI001F0F5D8B|nr:hypothetical protein [Acidaminobacter sp. JC074]MCH4886079.1 hypothetical protein [Acidaminobacter sp. JC074]